MAKPSETRIAIVGAGLSGSLMACYLARAGYSVSVYERRGDPREHGFIGGRSINLALSKRGLDALAEVGLAEDVLRAAIPMPGRMIHSTTGKLTFQPYSSNANDRIYSVSRGELNVILLNAADEVDNVQLYFHQRCTSIDFARITLTFDEFGSGLTRTEGTDHIIGADGAFSAVRLQMMLHMDRFEYSQSYLEHGYKELTIPATSAGEFALDPNALHIWPRGGYMMIALPNQDRTFTCTLFWPFTGPNGFDALKSDDDILSYFNRNFPDAVPLMPKLMKDYRENPVSSLVTTHCSPWSIEHKALLIGDAAHAIVPFYGQGMNCAFEDCRILNECLTIGNTDWRATFNRFQSQRKPNTDAIAEMAMDNFIEMRDHTASKLFHLKKKGQHALHRIFPAWYLPLYNMVSFSSIPYAKARLRARRQNRIIQVCCACIVAIVLLVGWRMWYFLRAE